MQAWPGSVKARFRAGMAQLRLGQLAAACRSFSAGLQFVPGHRCTLHTQHFQCLLCSECWRQPDRVPCPCPVLILARLNKSLSMSNLCRDLSKALREAQSQLRQEITARVHAVNSSRLQASMESATQVIIQALPVNQVHCKMCITTEWKDLAFQHGQRQCMVVHIWLRHCTCSRTCCSLDGPRSHCQPSACRWPRGWKMDQWVGALAKVMRWPGDYGTLASCTSIL